TTSSACAKKRSASLAPFPSARDISHWVGSEAASALSRVATPKLSHSCNTGMHRRTHSRIPVESSGGVRSPAETCAVQFLRQQVSVPPEQAAAFCSTLAVRRADLEPRPANSVSPKQHVVALLPRGEAIRNFVYSGALDLVAEQSD